MSNEEKMREKFNPYTLFGYAFGTKEAIASVKGFDGVAKACAAIKDAEIAARDLMIKELLDILRKYKSAGVGNSIDLNQHLDAYNLAYKALANSEHIDGKALEKALREAELKLLKDWLEGRYFIADKCTEIEAKLAELNKE